MRSFGLVSSLRDEWLVRRQAAKLFFLATLLVLAVTPQLLGWVSPLSMPAWIRVPWAVLTISGTVALFFLWFGMWRYWARVDDSKRSTRRIWFLVLLFGFWYGSCVYYYCVYLPQVIRRERIGS
jgi:hypothetical protein